MKKTYINPITEIVMLAKPTLLAGSNPEGFNSQLNSTTGGNGGSALGREFDFFDEE